MDVLMRRIRGDGFEKMADNLLSSNFAIKKVSEASLVTR